MKWFYLENSKKMIIDYIVYTMKIKKHLGLAPLIDGFKKSFLDYKDERRETSTVYSALDTALSGLACMFYK